MKRKLLWDELYQYGYVFSWKKSLGMYGVVVAFALLLGQYFHLDGIYLVLLCGWCAFLFPFFLRNLYRNRYGQLQFVEANTYMEQFLYSFQKSGKVLVTLKDVEKLLAKGRMHTCIRDAITYIEKTYGENQVEAKALSRIEQEYPLQQMATMHRFALQVEQNGGEYGDAILLMLDARRMWADREYELLKEKKRKRTQILVSVVVSLLLCSAFVYVANGISMTISDYALVKVTTLATLLIDLWIFYVADKKLASGSMEKTCDEKDLLRQYEKVKRCDAAGKRELGYGIAKRKVTRALQKVFPQWLLEVSLLLQSENVQVAIMESYEEAPLLLKPELRQLIQDLQQKPTDMEPYLAFLQTYALPEVQSSMKMLYSLSEGTGGNASSQISDIIRRNQLLFDQAQKMKNEDALGGLYALFLAPQLTGGAKMLVDQLWNRKKSMKTNKTKPIPEDVFDKILYHAVHDEKDILTKAGIIIQSQTGLRINEVLSIQEGCVKRTSDGCDYMEVTLGKTEKGEPIIHKVFINDIVKDAITELSEYTSELRKESGLKELFLCKSAKKKNAINVYSLEHWNDQKLSLFINKYDIQDNKGELYPLTSHQFRATFVRELIKRKVPIAMIMKQYSHVSIEMTAHYLTLQEEEVKEIYSDMILSPESKIAGLRAKEIKSKLDGLFHGKTEDEIDDVITDLAKTMSFNPLPTGVCLYDFRRGNCTDGDGCFFYNCPNYITEVQFYPILKDELDLLEKEMARLKELGQEPAYQVQAVKYKYLKPLVESLEVQLNGKESVG